jgi:predicted small lipoprotein YifL
MRARPEPRIGRDASFETPASQAPQDDGKLFIKITNPRHPEERPRRARLEGRIAPVAAVIGRMLILLLIVFTLAGCGKKGAPQPPPDEPNTYPRTYPSG